MSLMISVSGIRGIVGESLSPANLVAFSQAFATLLHKQGKDENFTPKIVIGRDTRPTGHAIATLVSSAMTLCGCDVIDVGMATTPTVEIATAAEKADGGIIVTASHNPVEWNALKLLDRKGEFLDENAVQQLLDIFRKKQFTVADWKHVGSLEQKHDYDGEHIRRILSLPCIDREQIAEQRFRVLIDAVEGAGSSIVPELCRQLGVEEIETISCNGTGIFPRNPEPLAENLVETVDSLKKKQCDFAIVVDPDVDRLALICEDGTLFGEEYSLVACADFYLRYKPGTVVNNLSSTRALRDVAKNHGQTCFSAKVGEANVVTVMKERNAVIGGEGNGGIILPELHYGRDALAGIALMLQAFAEWREKDPANSTLSGFRKQYPDYFMAKQKVRLADKPENLQDQLLTIASAYPEASINTEDGIKLDFPEEWVHIRPSNTEPILRIYTEAKSMERAEKLAETFLREISSRIDTL
ncbi:phosphoglucosamine mutase [Prosthecochloris sp. SCSIO W1103]|uniref:phosphoglucosamine mutase n=1 Tax=Prosthecochloris sp. SCSIO W1103 TaxID=2992244 RepID=UPI00223C9B46|nr:phosphoglucosamine mutase [Prosthecochloris sp. SCSIO W1103]UZJ37274.1 phosphoglucosamine mutase [Prosthecochloris sp. SCSIO W1103]